MVEGRYFEPGELRVRQALDAPEDRGRIAGAVEEARDENLPRAKAIGEPLDHGADAAIGAARFDRRGIHPSERKPTGVVNEAAKNHGGHDEQRIQLGRGRHAVPDFHTTPTAMKRYHSSTNRQKAAQRPFVLRDSVIIESRESRKVRACTASHARSPAVTPSGCRRGRR